MLLKQEFKTFDGAQRRAAFENAHSKLSRFTVVRCVNGVPDTDPHDASKYKKYTWRLLKTRVSHTEGKQT